MSIILSAENYYSDEANAEFMSVSQYKTFAGTRGMLGCEEYALAKLRGEWKDEPSTALLVGSYVDAFFEGTIDRFISKHPEIFTKGSKDKAPQLRSEYEGANKIIKRIERDNYFMKCMSGEKQRIFTGEIFGVQWKCKIDSFVPGIAVVDLKTTKSIRDGVWASNKGFLSFVEYFGYDIQGAIYQELVRINTGKKLPFLIAAASKESFTDIEVIAFDQHHLDMVFSGIFMGLARINDLKSNRGFVPKRCESCDYCHATKVLSGPIHFKDLTA